MTNSSNDPQPCPPRTARLWKYLFLGLLAADALIVGRDLAPRIEQRLSRRQMAGDLADREFQQRVLSRAREELSADRFRRLNDQTRLLIWDDMRCFGSNAAPHSFSCAMLAKGIAVADARQPDSRNIAALRKFYDEDLVSPDGKWQEDLTTVDQTMHGPILLYLAEKTGDDRYRKAADQMASYLLDRSAAEGGTICYDSLPMGKIHLVDTLGLICPFLAEYGRRFDRPQALNVAVGLFQDFLKFGIEPRTGLPFHGYNPDDQNRPVGIAGWGRGTGWYATGLVDTLPWLDKTHPQRPLLEEALKNLAASLRHYRRPDGGWNALLYWDGPYDSGCTAMLAYVLQQGMMQGILASDYSRDIAAAMDSLKRHTRANGIVDFAQGDALMSINRHCGLYLPAPYAQGMVLAVWAAHETPE